MTTRTVIYTLSGLGLSPEIFQRLNIEADEIHHLHWINPQKHESLDNYVHRMIAAIKPMNQRTILIGHSFGGVIMQEAAKLLQPDKVILISSIKSKKELPISMKFWMKFFPVYKIATKTVMIKTFRQWGPYHGYDTNASQDVFLNAVMQHTPYYFRWAICQICNWKGDGDSPSPVVHIHGDSDKTFPFRKIKAPITVDGGSHVMVFNKANNISDIINQKIHNG